MILESIVTTRNLDGSINVSPMGPLVSADLSRFELRPFNTSTTFANLKRTQEGILHVTDDVLLFARAAIGRVTDLPDSIRGKVVDVDAISNACRWYEFTVEALDESTPRVSLKCRTLHHHRERDFFGFNRAKHAVLEAAILATRLDFLPREEIDNQFKHLQTLVSKTGGQQEQEAFALLQDFIHSKRHA